MQPPATGDKVETNKKRGADGGLTVTALYTAQAQLHAGFDGAEIFATTDSRRVFDFTNGVIGLARLVDRSVGRMHEAIAQRHAFIDETVRRSGASQVLELAAGLSRRGVSFSVDDALRWTELELPPVAAMKRELLQRTEAGRTVLQRPNFTIKEGDATATDFSALVEPTRRLFVIAEGLFMYLTAAEQSRTWAAVAQALRRAGGGSFVFDLTLDADDRPSRTSRVLSWLVKRSTNGTGFRKVWRNRDEVASALLTTGFDNVAVVDLAEVDESWHLPYARSKNHIIFFMPECLAPAGHEKR